MNQQDNPIAILQNTIDTYWAKAHLGKAVTVATTRSDDGSPHVEPINGAYDIVITERGNEQERISNLSLADATRWYLHGMAVGHAQKAELVNRTPPAPPRKLANGLQDSGYSRWNWMAPTIQTMQTIDSDFGNWTKDYYLKVFTNHPLEEHEIRNAKFPLLV